MSRLERETQKGHNGLCLWFTGLSGSGKSSIAAELETLLFEQRIHTYLLDGDNIRHGLNRDLGFSAEGRKENIRRIGEVAKLFVDAGVVVLTAFISPFRSDRDTVRGLMPERRFVEIFVQCELSVCERRDPKGLYKKARANEVADFTGVTSPYEVPLHPELTLENSGARTIREQAGLVLEFLLRQNYLSLTKR